MQRQGSRPTSKTTYRAFTICPIDGEEEGDGTIIQIVAALAAGALAAGSEVAGQAVKDAYAGLKDLVVRKLGGKGEVEAAVRLLEQKPESEGAQDRAGRGAPGRRCR